MGSTNIWTHTLVGGSLSILAEDNVLRMSVISRSGTISVAGSRSFKGIPSDPVSLTEGQGVTLTASVTGNPIDGVTITSESSSDIAEIIVAIS